MPPPPPSLKKRSIEDAINGRVPRPKKRIRKQVDYHSSSDSEDDDLGHGKGDVDGHSDGGDGDDASSDGSGDDDVEASDLNDDSHDDAGGAEESIKATSKPAAKSKRNDPSAFATSISRILSTKLPAAGRADPVLARSRGGRRREGEDDEGGNDDDDDDDAESRRLERKVRAAERQQQVDKARVTDALAATADEKRLRKTAQRGVVRLFNAVRAAQVRAAEQKKQAAAAAVVGIDKREAKAREMSRDAFLQKMMV